MLGNVCFLAFIDFCDSVSASYFVFKTALCPSVLKMGNYYIGTVVGTSLKLECAV